MQELVAKSALLLTLALTAPASIAQGVAPDALLQAVTVKVIDKMRLGLESGATDPGNVATLVDTDIVPLFDFDHMTRLAMARNWRLATPAQQRLLSGEFKTLLVRTYSNALAQYRSETIDFKRLRAAPRDAEVTVKSEVRQPGKELMTLDYAMEKTPAGWRIYDVKVAGVGLVSTYREVFAEKVREVGVDGLIKFLADGNREGGSRFNSVKSSFWERSRLMYAIFQNVFRSSSQQ